VLTWPFDVADELPCQPAIEAKKASEGAFFVWAADAGKDSQGQTACFDGAFAGLDAA
jgi:hypothetical protein